MTDGPKYLAFMAGLDALCRKHRVCLSPRTDEPIDIFTRRGRNKTFPVNQFIDCTTERLVAFSAKYEENRKATRKRAKTP